MIGPLLTGVTIFGLSFIGLSLVELIIHKLTKNRDKSYRWGVWLFSILLGLYGFYTSLGR